MIQPNELRIGNWLLYEGKPTQVEAIDPEREVKELDLSCAIRIKEYFTTPGGPYTTNGRWLNHFKPIPLTPEWLERCGFKFTGTRDKDAPDQTWAYDIIEIWEHDEGFCHDYGHGGDVNFLHDLQNLYYALTRKELSIKAP